MRRVKNLPYGMEALHSCNSRKYSYSWYKGSVLVLTFLCYAGYHASRKPPSIVKSVLRGSHPRLGGRNLLASDFAVDVDQSLMVGWAPFNGTGGQSLLGQVDLAFLGTYAVGMFYAGHLGDRLDLRWFLTIGMTFSGIFIAMFGMAFFYDIHSYSYFIVVSVFAGLFQSTGWPSVVSIVANWSGKGKRGLVMGIWNANTSIGNILGTVMSAALLSQGWGWSFVVPGLLMIALAVLINLFLVVHPNDVGLTNPDERSSRPLSSGIITGGEEEMQPLKEGKDTGLHAREKVRTGTGSSATGSRDEPQGLAAEAEGVHFADAWRIPGVASYAFCLFFSKLIAYTFLYWLPYYIKSTPIEGRLLSARQAGDLSVLFDVGGVAGGVLAGHLSDKTGSSAVVAVSFTLLSVPCLYLYRILGHTSFSTNVVLMMASGFFVNGPYALITTAVSADLGTHDSLQGNAKALATVTAIIDGMGSIGAALGPMLTGYISERGGFDMVFTMLYSAAVIAGLLLIRLAGRELAVMRARAKGVA